MTSDGSRVRFPLGQLVATPGALAALANAHQLPAEFIARHQRGDWGDLDDEDRAANDAALRGGGARLLSAYLTRLGAKIWIITEADRSSTCILLPEDY